MHMIVPPEGAYAEAPDDMLNAAEDWWPGVCRVFGDWESTRYGDPREGLATTRNAGFKATWVVTADEHPTYVTPLTAEAELWLMMNPRPFGEVREGPAQEQP